MFTASSPTPDRCPCDTGLAYRECCGPLHEGARAGTAVALMRSRYSAFALGLVDHLVRTWHPRTRPTDLTLEEDLTWQRLEIHRTVAGAGDDETGVVEFTAHFTGPAGPDRLHEVSRFARRANRWLYLDGEVE